MGERVSNRETEAEEEAGRGGGGLMRTWQGLKWAEEEAAEAEEVVTMVAEVTGKCNGITTYTLH